MTDQYEHKFIDLSSVSPQSKFLESYPNPPLATSTLYLNKHTTTNQDGSNNYRLVGVHIVLKEGDPNGLWEFLVDKKKTIDDSQKPNVETKSLEIYCDTLEVYGEFSVSEADVSIFARRIIWATPDAAINTSPLNWTISRASEKDHPAHGRKAGDLTVFISPVNVDNVETVKRFIANGGNGQHAALGSNGDPGEAVESKSQDIIKVYGGLGGGAESRANVTFDPPAIGYRYKGRLLTSSDYFSEWGSKDFPKDGHPATAPGKPGNAGNAGQLITNSQSQAISQHLTSLIEGKAGDKAPDCYGGNGGTPTTSAYYEVIVHDHMFGSASYVGYNLTKLNEHTSSKGKDELAPDADIPLGYSPVPVVKDLNNAWLHPLSLQKAIEYARDLFLSNSREEVQNFLAPYHEALSLDLPTQAGVWGESNYAQWISAQSEISTMLLRLSSHLDYFGNPGGFAPFLSLASTINLYKNEIEIALRAFLLASWLNKQAESINEKSVALQESINALNNDTETAAQQIVQTEQEINSTIKSIEDTQKQLEGKATALDKLRTDLLNKAEHTLEQEAHIKFAIKMCAAVCQVIPVGQPILGTVATTLGSVVPGLMLASSDKGKPDTSKKFKEAFEKCKNAYEQCQGVREKAKTVKKDTNVTPNSEVSGGNKPAASSDKPAEDSELARLKAKNDGWTAVGKGVGPALSQVSEALSALKVPKPEVDAELERLIAQSGEWTAIVKDIQNLNNQKSKQFADLERLLQVLGDNYARISSNASATVKMHQQIAKSNLSLDLETVSFVDQMWQRAKSRLLYYSYLMVKAYETTFLRPCNYDWWSLTKVVEEVDSFLKNNEESKLDILSYNQEVEILKPLFEEDLEEIRTELREFYSKKNPGNITPDEKQDIVFSNTQTPDVLKRLREGGEVVINPIQYGLFDPSKEMSRISGVSVLDIQFLDLKLISCKTVEDIPQGYRDVMVVAKVGEHYHIRIFANNRSKVFEANEPTFKFKTNLRQRLDIALQNLKNAAISEDTARNFIKEINSVIGYTELDSIQFLDLELIFCETVEDIPHGYRNVMVVAKVGEHYHIRIFANDKSQVFEADEPTFKFKTNLRQRLDIALQNLKNAAISEDTARNFIKEINSVIGYTELDSNEKITIIVRPARVGTIRSSYDFYSICSESPLVWSTNYSNSDQSGILGLSMLSTVADLFEHAEKEKRIDDNLNFFLKDPDDSIKEKLALMPLLSDFSIEVVYGSQIRHRITGFTLRFKTLSLTVGDSEQKVLQLKSVGSSGGALIEIKYPSESTDRDSSNSIEYAYQQMIRIFPRGKAFTLSVPSVVDSSGFNAHFEKWDTFEQGSGNTRSDLESVTDVVLSEHTTVTCYWSSSPKSSSPHLLPPLNLMVLEEGETVRHRSIVENLPIYLESSSESRILDVLPNPNHADILKEGEEGWQQINYKGIVGWIKR